MFTDDYAYDYIDIVQDFSSKTYNYNCFINLYAWVFTVAVDIFTNLFLGKGITAYWSLPAIIACTAITILLLVVSRLAKLKAIIRKKMHI